MPALLHLLNQCLELLIPARKTEVLLRETTLTTYEGLVQPHTIAGNEALLPYSDKRVSALIWELKYKDSKRAAVIAGKLLAEYLAGMLAEEMIHHALLIPVPLHPNRQRERGYNQCERIIQQVPQNLDNVTPSTEALTRVRDTPRQTTLGRTMRLRNIAGAFAADPDLVRGKTCIVIDDVITTGTTLGEARNILLHAGASKVIAITLAYA
jgi:ComF family protein